MYTLINTNGTPLDGFYPNDCEYAGIFDFSKSTYTTFKSRKEAQDYYRYMQEQVEANRERWGDVLANQVTNFLKVVSIRKIK